MQAIATKYIGPTNYRGSRIKAYSEAFPRGLTLSWDHALGVEENHDTAARAFIKAKNWEGVWVRGGSADSKGNVYVCVARRTANVEAGRGIVNSSGDRVLTIERHAPKSGAPFCTPTEADEITRLYADLFYVQRADLVIERER